MAANLTPAQQQERQAMYDRGDSDAAIARHFGTDHTSIYKWRRKRGLPSNKPQCAELDPAHPQHRPAVSADQKLADYREGLSDPELGARWGYHPKYVQQWRTRHGLAPHVTSNRQLTPEERAGRMLLYQFGYSDGRIAREQRVAASVIARWRQRLDLKPNRAKAGLSVRGRKHREADLFARIKRAMPSYMSPADRDDAASNLFLAVMSGEIPIEDVEKRAKAFGNRVVNDFASKWGNRSLDQELGENDGFTLMETLVDTHSTSWLEEMGATMW